MANGNWQLGVEIIPTCLMPGVFFGENDGETTVGDLQYIYI